MACARYEDWVSAAAAGALDPAREAELRAHLLNCSACAKEFEQEQSLMERINCGVAELAAAPSAEFLARVRLRVAQEAARPAGWLTGWVPASAAALALLLIVFWLSRPPAPPGGAEPPRATAATARALALAPPAEPPAQISARGKARGEFHAVRQGRGHVGAPEVLIFAREWEGVVMFSRALEQGHIDRATLLQEAPFPPQPLEIPELKIEPLEKPASGAAGETSAGAEGRGS